MLGAGGAGGPGTGFPGLGGAAGGAGAMGGGGMPGLMDMMGAGMGGAGGGGGAEGMGGLMSMLMGGGGGGAGAGAGGGADGPDPKQMLKMAKKMSKVGLVVYLRGVVWYGIIVCLCVLGDWSKPTFRSFFVCSMIDTQQYRENPRGLRTFVKNSRITMRTYSRIYQVLLNLPLWLTVRCGSCGFGYALCREHTFAEGTDIPIPLQLVWLLKLNHVLVHTDSVWYARRRLSAFVLYCLTTQRMAVAMD